MKQTKITNIAYKVELAKQEKTDPVILFITLNIKYA